VGRGRGDKLTFTPPPLEAPSELPMDGKKRKDRNG
jgi:hypothetical protein